MDITLYNTLTHRKEVFQPIEAGQVKMYSCGPTVYNYAHIGNLRAYVFADVLKRMFLINDYSVRHVMNITDVGHLTSDADEGEDKLEKGAIREGKTVREIADFYTQAFRDDLAALKIIEPDIFCRATDHVADMIGMIKVLEEKGYTYTAGDNVYFDTAKFRNYGKMARLVLSPEVMRARVEEDTFKRSPFDFVLWFTRYKYASHEMKWDSPWGVGFPGWHIECSAMASKYLGKHFDIHTGGIDHIPVHHTNEIAQSEGAWGQKWVNYWLHNEFLVMKDGKMAKSTGEFLRLKVLTDHGFNPHDYRYLLLGSHYRSQVQFSFEALSGAKNALERARVRIAGFKQELGSPAQLRDEQGETIKAEFLAAINDDLNTSKGLALFWKVLDDSALSAPLKLELIQYFDRIFALDLLADQAEKIPNEIDALAQQRLEFRQQSNWPESDRLRDEIAKLGYEVLDTKEGYQIRKV